MHRSDIRGVRDISGRAYLDLVCDSMHKVSVSEEIGSFVMSATFSHELAHSLGILLIKLKSVTND